MEHPPIKNGIYMGGVLVALALIAYVVNSTWLFHPGLRIAAGLLVPLYFMYRTITEQRLEEEGKISFGEALKAGFIAFLVGTLIYSLFQYVLVNFIDTGLQEVAKEQMLAYMDKFAGMAGAESEELLETVRTELDKQGNLFGFGSTALSWMQGLIGGFILSAIMSAILKRS